VRQSISDGIFAQSAAPRISNARFLYNGRDGLRTVSGSAPTITNSTLRVIMVWELTS